MRSKLVGVIVIALSTLLEAVRNRILLVGVLFGLVLVGASVAAASVSIGERARMIVDVGLAASSGLGSVIAVALMVSSFAGELRKHTAYPVLARPLPRGVFIVGKYVGVVLTLVLVTTLMLLGTALTVALYGDPVPSSLFAAAWLTYCEVAVVTGIALVFSTMASPVLAATYAVGLVLVGNLSTDLQQLGARLVNEGKPAGHLLKSAYTVAPDLARLSVRTQAANSLEVPAGYLAAGTLYAGLYAACALVLAVWVFNRRGSV